MSERNEHEAQNSAKSIEGWYLTAYALGELDEDSRKVLEAWLTKHPEAHQEIEAIRQTASRVERELTSLPVNLQLDSTRSNKIKEAIASVATAKTPSQINIQSDAIAPNNIRHRRILFAITTGLAAALAGIAFWVNQPHANKSLVSAPANQVPTDSKSIAAKDTASRELFYEEEFVQTERFIDSEKHLAEVSADTSESKLEFRRRGTAGGMGGMGSPGGGAGLPSGGGLSAANIAKDDRLELRMDKKSSEGLAPGFQRDFDFPEELKSNVPSLRRVQESSDRVSGDRFDPIPETPFSSVSKEPLSTFSIDVDTASYSKLRQYVLENNVVPPASSIRIEEWLNYFDYKYPGPAGDDPFAAHMKMGDCPWNAKHKLVRVAIQAKKVANQDRPKSNLVFLIDVSGSMADANKLPLVKRTLGLLTAQLREQDRVAIAVYAGASGCVLPSTSGVQKDQILASINELQSGGSTNGGSGIELAYRIAKENFIPGGVNRVILCTDGDFNVGVTGTDALVSMMQEQAKSNIFLTCLGYGIGNYNDSMMEQISDKGNGTYAMVDSEMEARRVMTEQLSGTLVTVAKDVKIQIEFNPAKVHSYRLIGYENRRLAAADFNNDRKDAGEIGAGHRVTALYEIVPVGQEESIPGTVDELRFSKAQKQEPSPVAEGSVTSKDWLLLKIRSKQPESSQSTKQEFVLGEVANEIAYAGEQSDFDWALSVAEFGLLMRQSQLAPGMDWDKMLSRAMDATGSDPYRRECVTIMQRAKALSNR
ncbi:MAG: von Willebrand factor type A domain-containing protein [Planctomycetaceae bacterium]|jgi:Ca-activated chloride channel family protein|nr:von Willebrand factor type A domain-containing protein [Planctomycetaceae bacterium]